MSKQEEARIAFVQPQGPLREAIGGSVPALPVPAHRVEALFGADRVGLEAVIDAVHDALALAPDLFQQVRGPMAGLIDLHTRRMVEDHFLDNAEHHLALGLWYKPESIRLRSRYAVVLHMLGRNEDARIEYETVFQAVDGPDLNPLRILAARNELALDNPKRAFTLLMPIAETWPRGSEFWDLYGEARRRAGIPFPDLLEGRRASPSAEGGCPDCGAAVPEKAKFCPDCGSKAPAKTDNKVCGACSTKLPARAKYCGACGEAL